MIANKIKPKIEKVINKFPTIVTVYRDTKNEFGEPNGKDQVCEITGFYHEGASSIQVSLADKGEIKSNKAKYLMVLHDDTSIKIKENDYFILEDKKHIIKDKSNPNMLNIYFDLLLEVRNV